MPRLRNPGTENYYHFDLKQWEKECPLTGPFLGAAVRSSFYQESLSLPGIQTFFSAPRWLERAEPAVID
jgi:hypothetical protein